MTLEVVARQYCPTEFSKNYYILRKSSNKVFSVVLFRKLENKTKEEFKKSLKLLSKWNPMGYVPDEIWENIKKKWLRNFVIL